MLLDFLVSQFVLRFQHEKRAQSCLWFDERQEFGRLLPALRTHLAQSKEAPFRLLEYDPEQSQGQVWLKYQIHRVLEAAVPNARHQVRFVVYLPVSEDRLDASSPEGDPPLDLLAEYQVAGVVWRIGGKRPTLFSFLRQAGVALPDGPSEQRRLYEGGRDSVLAKYVATFIDRPHVFWATLLTPELAQSRLLPDIDQSILDLAMDPEGTWRDLHDRGLDREFLELVRERYGFQGPANSPDEWVREAVTVLALTETYRGYGEPTDFPFLDRLPPLAIRPLHVQLLQRWLRDSECRAAWDHWVADVEAKLDLTEWATGRDGLSFGFPHLVRLRWSEVWTAFEQAATKGSTTAAFFERYGEVLNKQAEFARASGSPVGAWELLRSLGAFARSCDDARKEAELGSGVEDLARVYVDWAAAVERQHVQIRYDAEKQGFEDVVRVADRAYATYTNTLNGRFFEMLAAAGTGAIPGFEPVSRLELVFWNSRGKRALIIVDALRYDCALAIASLLYGPQVEVEPLVAVLPTVTPIGMTAMLPISSATVGLVMKSNGVHPTVNGKDTSARSNRLAYLKEFGADCRDIADVESASAPPTGIGELLVVYGHEEVDHIGHGDAQTLVRHVALEIERLAQLVRKLHRWGYPRVHMTTDHGFILIAEDKLPEEVPCNKEWCHVLKERFALVPASADLPVATFPFAWDPSVRVAVPPGLAFFRAEKSFSHGGAALQELIIPHLVSKSQLAEEKKRMGVEVVLATYELMRTAVKVVLRPVLAGPAKTGQMALFTGTGRSLMLDVTQTDAAGKRSSVLASGAKAVRLEPEDKEQTLTLFFHTAATFQVGELLDLDIRDTETTEQFPLGGIKLTVGRDM